MMTSDWPKSGIRTRVFGVLSVGLVVAESGLVVMHPWGAASLDAANYAGLFVTVIAIAMAVWSAFAYSDKRIIALSMLMAAGISLRAFGLLKFTYRVPAIPPLTPDPVTRWVLYAAYACLFGGLLGSAFGLGSRVHAQRPALLALGATLLLGAVFGAAAYAPLPALATVLTARDEFAIALLVGDLLLLGLASFVMFALLEVPGGALSRAWVWLFVGLMLAAAGDSVFPLLEPVDTTMYTSLLWGGAYALVGIGASLSVDIMRWHASRGETVNRYGVEVIERSPEDA